MKKFLSLFCVMLLSFILLAGCSGGETEQNETLLQFQTPNPGDTIAVFVTSKGTFKAVLYADHAPLAVQNFIRLASVGFYDGMEFHRVISDFVVQSGDPATKEDSTDADVQPFRNEYSENLHHYPGALGMANDRADHNTTQFYVVKGASVSQDLLGQLEQQGYSSSVIDAYNTHGGLPTLDNRYTVFGQVYEGLDVITKISKVNTDGNDRPKKAVTITSVTIEIYEIEE